jgi:hypothetical protein
MALIKGRVNFQAKPHQRAVLNDRKRHRGVVMHRRAGKTVTAVFDGYETVLACPLPSPRVVYIAPFLKQAKKLAWDYMASVAKSGNRTGEFFDISKGDLCITYLPTDSKFFLLGADNIDAIRGMYFDKAIVDEVADCDPRLWDSVLRPALADRQGRALLMGTPKGRMNKLYELSRVSVDDPTWSFHNYNVLQTGMLPQHEIDEARRDMQEALFEQEFMCSFNAALVGAVYGKEMDALQKARRLTMVKYDRTLPIVTAWDLGWADATSVGIYQIAGTEIRCIGYLEFTLTKLPDCIKGVREWCGEREVDLTGARHIGPHDLEVHEYGSGMTRKQIAANMGFDFELSPKGWSLADGVESVRNMLDHFWMDEGECAHLLECLVNYSYGYDDLNRSFKTTPKHDWTSHGVDQLRMLATAYDRSNFISQPLLFDTGNAGYGRSRRDKWY